MNGFRLPDLFFTSNNNLKNITIGLLSIIF